MLGSRAMPSCLDLASFLLISHPTVAFGSHQHKKTALLSKDHRDRGTFGLTHRVE